MTEYQILQIVFVVTANIVGASVIAWQILVWRRCGGATSSSLLLAQFADAARKHELRATGDMAWICAICGETQSVLGFWAAADNLRKQIVASHLSAPELTLVLLGAALCALIRNGPDIGATATVIVIAGALPLPVLASVAFRRRAMHLIEEIDVVLAALAAGRGRPPPDASYVAKSPLAPSSGSRATTRWKTRAQEKDTVDIVSASIDPSLRETPLVARTVSRRTDNERECQDGPPRMAP